MAQLPRSLARGLISSDLSILYSAPTGSSTIISIMNFSNNGLVDVTLNIYKRSKDFQTQISPKDFLFKSNNLAQEDGQITLESGDEILAKCSVADVVDYSINGFLVV